MCATKTQPNLCQAKSFLLIDLLDWYNAKVYRIGKYVKTRTAIDRQDFCKTGPVSRQLIQVAWPMNFSDAAEFCRLKLSGDFPVPSSEADLKSIFKATKDPAQVIPNPFILLNYSEVF